MRLVFAGTPEVAAIVLRALIASDHEVVGVVTRPDAPRGRGRSLYPSAVAAVAQEAGIPTLKTSRLDAAALEAIAAWEPECIPVVAYGALVPEHALDLAPHGWVNMHFSLLPRFRGAAPVPAALAAGDTQTGVTIFRIDAGMDTGPILAQTTREITDTDTAGTLLNDLAHLGAPLFIDTLHQLAAGEITPQPQSDEGSTYAAKFTADDARVHWTAPAAEISHRVRAMTPAPGAWTMLGEDRIKLGPVALEAHEDQVAAAWERMRGGANGDTAEQVPQPGQVIWQKNRVWAMTGDGPVLLSQVQTPGKKMMNAGDWVRGARLDASGNGVVFR